MDYNITPTLLLWTRYYRSVLWHRNNSEAWEIECGNGKLKLYQDKSLAKIEEMDAILFHLPRLELSSMPQKNLNQKWILYSMEAPNSLGKYSQHQLKNVRKIQDKIDWVISYRHDADIFDPYGFSYKTTEHFKEGETHRIPTRLPKNQRYVYGYYKKDVASKTVGTLKGKQVAWLVSNCKASSNRQGFVKELSKYIKVDIYGACGRRCPQTADCRQFIAQEYNFYLSFENSLCKDYATEKLFESLRVGILPIVFGGANYSEILPPNSFIDALSFKSPKELAIYLISISKNQQLYSLYFEWRENHKIFVRKYNETALCGVYDAIVEKRNSRTDHNVYQWLKDESECWQWRQ